MADAAYVVRFEVLGNPIGGEVEGLLGHGGLATAVLLLGLGRF
jgi:hypothetical protein